MKPVQDFSLKRYPLQVKPKSWPPRALALETAHNVNVEDSNPVVENTWSENYVHTPISQAIPFILSLFQDESAGGTITINTGCLHAMSTLRSG